MALKHFISTRRAQIVLRDGDEAELEVDTDDSTFSLTGFGEGDSDVEYERIRVRGKIVGLEEADDVDTTGTLNIQLTSLAGASSVLDFLRRTGAYSTNVSTLGADHPYAIDIVFRHANRAGAVDEWECKDCVCRIDTFQLGRPATASISFQAIGGTSRTNTPAP